MAVVTKVQLSCDNPECAVNAFTNRLECLHVKEDCAPRDRGELLISTILPGTWVAYTAYGERATLMIEGLPMTTDQYAQTFCSEECHKVFDAKKRLGKKETYAGDSG